MMSKILCLESNKQIIFREDQFMLSDKLERAIILHTDLRHMLPVNYFEREKLIDQYTISDSHNYVFFNRLFNYYKGENKMKLPYEYV